MTTNQASIDRLKQVKQISLIPWLEKNGYKLENTGNYVRCYSPFRNEGNASFDINLRRPDKWRDRGNGKHGDLLDLVMMITGKTHREAIDYLLGEENKNLPKFEPVVREKNAIEIINAGEIKSPWLWDYIDERQIMPEIASKYLVELEFKFNYGKHPERVSRALGFRNNSGGYEIRSKSLKISNSPKDVTTFKGMEHSNVYHLYEGFFSFLSDRFRNETKLVATHIVLNSLSFLPQVLAFLPKDAFIYSYLDNDTAGDKATQTIKDGFNMEDMRSIYEGYNDLNDYICGKPLKKKIKSIKELLG